jgi:PPOX class probable F420-dependent enzyme
MLNPMVRVDLSSKKNSDFLTKGKAKLLRLAVGEKDGTPHVSSVWYLWRDGHFYISTSEDRLKVRAIRKNPKVALIVDTDELPYKGVIVEGRAQLTKKNIEEITLAIVKKYVPASFVKSQFEDLMKYPRVLIKIKPKKSIDIMSYRIRSD